MIWKKMFTSPRKETETAADNEKADEMKEEKTPPNEKIPDLSRGKSEGLREVPEEPGARSVEVTLKIDIRDDSQIGRTALLLAATTSSESENRLKKELATLGWRSVATEVGGLAGDLPQKITRALVGASLNAEVVEKTRNEMHALMHAALEALDGFLAVGMLEASVGAKIAIVRNSRWIAVAVMGDTAYHAVAHHERCGLGVMHI